MRIRWRGVARVAAVVIVALIALRLLPGLLRAPEPPPLAADVGLPRGEPVTDAPRHRAAQRVTEVPARGAAKPPARRRRKAGRPRGRPVRDAPASTAVIGSRHKRRIGRAPEHRPHPRPVVQSPPPQVPEYVPPAPPERLPELPPAPPSTPGDGSEEFAPH